MGEPRVRHRQSIYCRRSCLRTQCQGRRFLLGDVEKPATRHLGHLAHRHRPHQQPQHHQRDLRTRRKTGRRPHRADLWRVATHPRHLALHEGATYPQGRRGLGRRSRCHDPRLYQHRHVFTALAGATSGIARTDTAETIQHQNRARELGLLECHPSQSRKHRGILQTPSFIPPRRRSRRRGPHHS